MQEKVKQLRVSIDGIAQLTKDLKPFKETFFSHKVESDIESASTPRLEIVEKSFSNQPLHYKFHYLLKTDKGVFRWGNNVEQTIDEALASWGSAINLNSKEIEKAYDSLIFAKAWLGKVMGELGVKSPYKSGYKTKEDIEPTADVADKPLSNFLTNKGDWDKLSHIEKVDYLRTQIESIINEITPIQATEALGAKSPREFNIARTNSYNHLCEARFWLGFELQRIKEA